MSSAPKICGMAVFSLRIALSSTRDHFLPIFTQDNAQTDRQYDKFDDLIEKIKRL